MADTKTTALTELASGAIDDLDVAPVVDVSDTTQGASGTLKKFKWSSIKATLLTYFDTAYLKLTGGTIAGGTRTTSGSTLTITETLNNAGVTFPGALVVDVTDTASNSASLLVNIKVGGVSKVNVEKNGSIVNNAGGGINYFTRMIIKDSSNETSRIGANNLIVNSSTPVSWTNAAGSADAGDVDLSIRRDASNTLAQRNSTNAQTFRLYGTYTDASNYRRVALAMTTAGVASLAPEGEGTGASGNVLHISGLPTSNPGAGILWNDSGTVKVGT